MARIAGPGDGAEVGPERPEGLAQGVAPTGAGSPTSEPGELSGAENSAGVRTGVLADKAPADTGHQKSVGPEVGSNAGTFGDDVNLPPAAPEPWRSEESLALHRADEMPSGWDWEADAPSSDRMATEAGEEHDTDLRGDDEPMPSMTGFGLTGTAAGFGASAALPRDERSTAPLTPPPPKRRGVGALLLGGAAAAALGFGAAWFGQDRLADARLPADLEERLAALEARPALDTAPIETLSGRISEIEARLATLEEAPEPTTPALDPAPLREEFSAGLAQTQERAAALEERLAALEARPVEPAPSAGPGPAIQATPPTDLATPGLEPRLAAAEDGLAEVQAALTEAETARAALDERVDTNEAALSALDARLGEAETRLDAAESAGATAVEEARAAAAALEETRARAEAAEAEARREAAIAALDSALDAGQPFEAALPALDGEVPEALATAAAEGVPSLAALRETFPEAARAGLAAARQEGLVEDGGVLGFLSGQLSVRSTAPREGSDPDAVLSRAEAALAQGRLSEALAEIDALPEPARAAMSDWIAQARSRAEAEAALSSLRRAEPTPALAD